MRVGRKSFPGMTGCQNSTLSTGPIPAGRNLVLAFKRIGEGVLGRVTDLLGNRCQRCILDCQQPGRRSEAPPGEVRQRRPPDPSGEPFGECGPRQPSNLAQIFNTPRARQIIVDGAQCRANLGIAECLGPSGSGVLFVPGSQEEQQQRDEKGWYDGIGARSWVFHLRGEEIDRTSQRGGVSEPSGQMDDAWQLAQTRMGPGTD